MLTFFFFFCNSFNSIWNYKSGKKVLVVLKTFKFPGIEVQLFDTYCINVNFCCNLKVYHNSMKDIISYILYGKTYIGKCYVIRLKTLYIL